MASSLKRLVLSAGAALLCGGTLGSLGLATGSLAANSACLNCALASNPSCRPDRGTNPPTPQQQKDCVACVQAACGNTCGLDQKINTGYCDTYTFSP